MSYITRSCGSALAPKVIGSYERELHAAVDGVIAGDYERIIDVGCAEGYYAVGLAWRKRIPVVAYDSSAEARACLAELAGLNGVSSLIDGRETCDTEELESFSGQRVFLICDIEGAEGQLLDPTRAPALLGFDLLVEVHDGPRFDGAARRPGVALRAHAHDRDDPLPRSRRVRGELPSLGEHFGLPPLGRR